MVGNRAVLGLMLPTSVANSAGRRELPPEVLLQSRPHGKSTNGRPVQRTVEINGTAYDFAALKAEAEGDAIREKILTKWILSEQSHNFSNKDGNDGTARAALKTALTRAAKWHQSVEEVPVVPPLFALANFKFRTRASGRLETLYFKDGDDSGRIRQQHPTGPGVFAETHKVDFFFPNAASGDFAAFKTALGEVRGKPTEFASKGRRAKLEAAAGDRHYEVVFETAPQLDEGFPKGKVVNSHPSMGRVVLGHDGLSDGVIAAMFLRAVAGQ